jgi:transcriptional regulator with XRE-family HTH domain
MAKIQTGAELERQALKVPGIREGYRARLAMRELGRVLRHMRESRGLTQQQLARRTGLTQPAISRMEKGFSRHAPTIETLTRYMHGCNRKLLIGAGTSIVADLTKLPDLRTEL